MALNTGGIPEAMKGTVQSLFSKIREAKSRVGANYVRAGQYFLRMDAIKVDKTRGGDPFMAIEMTVVKVLDDDQGRGHKMGEGVCHWLGMKQDSFLGNLKAFIAHVMDMRPEEVGEEHAMALCAPDQPLTGTVVEVFARQIVTKKGTPFTEINYKREVTPAECLTVLSPEAQALYFPNDTLKRAAAAMAGTAAA